MLFPNAFASVSDSLINKSRTGPHPALVTFLLSCLFLSLLYFSTEHLLRLLLPVGADKDAVKAHRVKERKRRSWLLTLVGSAVTTTASLPFVWDLVVRGGWDVAKVQRRDDFAQTITSFFVAYLVTDCLIGLIRYREQMSILTGYLHHTAYTILLTHVLRHGYPHVFVLAAIMELPTFVLALGVLTPKFRSDLIFTGLFFATRIAFHIALIGLYGSTYGRTFGPQLVDLSSGLPIPSWVPLGGLMAAAPLHILWFTSSVRGTIKRRQIAALTRSQVPIVTPSSAVPIIITPNATSATTPPSPRLLPARPKLVSLASSYLLSPRTSIFPTPRLPTLSLNALSLDASAAAESRRLARARAAIEREVRSYFRAASAAQRQAWATATISKEDAERDENDVLKVLGGATKAPTLEELRVRAGRGGADLKRFGGRLRRRVVGGVRGMVPTQ